MFNFSGNLLAGQHDTQKARSPPSKPIPITFPCLQPPVPSAASPPPLWKDPGTGVTAQFLRLKKPSDVTKDTLAALNITFQPVCDFDTLFSSLPDNAHSHLPPKTWLDPPTDGQTPQTASPAVAAPLLSNSRKAPDQRDFYARLRELYFSNNDAFSTLTRKGNGSQAPLRLAHFRKFWEGLDNLAYYWDTSLDIYTPPQNDIDNHDRSKEQASLAGSANSIDHVLVSGNEDSASVDGFESLVGNEPRKKAKTEATNDNSASNAFDMNGFGNASIATLASSNIPSRVLPARNAPPKLVWRTSTDDQASSADSALGSYSGYRIGNGAEMPDQYRIDCVRAFIEPIAWAFGVTLSPHRRPPVLLLGHIRFPVRMSSVAWRGPLDRAKARQGWMEGPIVGVQCRADVNFGKSGDLEAESILDTVRELGGLLLLAQERAREGKTEKRAGDGKWWTTKQRWGGGPGGEVGEATEDTSVVNKGSTVKPEEAVERNRDGSRARRKPTPAEVWKTLKAGNPLWDPKVVYEAIGKHKGSDYDDVFMVSSLNHHISIIKLQVHRCYLHYITEGKLPDNVPAGTDWCSPKFQRTRWFDLFSIEDRTEAMRGIWGLMSYMMRANTDAPGDSATPAGANTRS
ncbi:hypothetical protein LEMA_P006520.1 [Plenodomus lingam JN3]|uniref:Uncharacterized protein n=1 Tax=Leptosphaeria maculans (strain JN3 / isolate v23.1.3 / race Av1-4-5-6-7-8) TaxID=985895 RepID=E5AF76_LEPMJ|nr:hypothetical protein LEMA_P006520.1 [Plenodomus lingam JN3]CBY01865.1 hypothetical protein LEMA_P006520.1 [Plenodomus lingam JN3]